MNKTELIAQVAEKTGLSKKDTESIINAAVDTIATTMAQGDKVQLSGFGIFEVKDRQARVGRNPKTKEAIEIPARPQACFKPRKACKDHVAECDWTSI